MQAIFLLIRDSRSFEGISAGIGGYLAYRRTQKGVINFLLWKKGLAVYVNLMLHWSYTWPGGSGTGYLQGTIVKFDHHMMQGVIPGSRWGMVRKFLPIKRRKNRQ